MVCKRTHLCLNLGLEDILQRNSIGSKLADSLTQLLNSHLVLVEVESEVRLVVDIGLLFDVEGLGVGSVELLGNGVGGTLQLFKKVGLFLLDMPLLQEN